MDTQVGGAFENKVGLFCELITFIFVNFKNLITQFLVMWRQFSLKNTNRRAAQGKIKPMQKCPSLCTPLLACFFLLRPYESHLPSEASLGQHESRDWLQPCASSALEEPLVEHVGISQQACVSLMRLL